MATAAVPSILRPPLTVPSRRAADWVIPLGSGIALGLFSTATDRTESFVFVGQLAGIWLLVAAGVGASTRRAHHAAAAATVTLLAAVATYYIAYFVNFDHLNRLWSSWATVSLVVGPPAGVAGLLAKRGRRGWRRARTQA